jgi:hypothetical protein
MMMSIPAEGAVMCNAFTVMLFVPPLDVMNCSFMTTMIAPNPSVTVWFGTPLTTIGPRPLTERFVMLLDPETPLHVATDCAITKSAVIVGPSATGRVMDRVPAEAMLFAVLSKPIVTATSPSTLPNGSVMGATVASIVPPPGGNSPVSTKGGSVPTAASKALPLKVVVAVDVEVLVNQAEARGTVE